MEIANSYKKNDHFDVTKLVNDFIYLFIGPLYNIPLVKNV